MGTEGEEGGAAEVVPEPEVKRLLGQVGVAVPAAVTGASPGDLAAGAAALSPPFVLKAWGPGLVHKTDAGAVVLGLDRDDLEAAATAMAGRLAAVGTVVSGFLVEEQAPEGLDVLVGAVSHPGVGVAVALGFGGQWAEVIDEAVLRLAPLSAADAREMVAAWRGARLLDGYRGCRAVGRDALVDVLTALAGPGGLVERVGRRLVALECNPLRLSPGRAVALDARLLLGPSAPATEPPPRGASDLGPLFEPRRVVIAGVSATGRASFGTGALRAYQALGWDEGLAVVHPDAPTIDGVGAYPSLAEVPGTIDYLLVAVPASACAGLLEGAEGKVRFVHVISGGFAESGPEGAALQGELVDAAHAVGARLLGPNCMGIYSARGRHAFQLGVPEEAGPVAVVSQSGGLSGDVVKVGDARGLRFSAVVSLGNAADLSVGELVEHFAADPATGVIGLYVEGRCDDGRLVPALRAIRGRKPAVLLVGGRSRQGSAAAASHTGALASDARLWEAVSVATGASVVATLEDLLGVLRFHQIYGPPRAAAPAGPPSVLVVGAGGGASVLATDACDRAGLEVAPTAEAVRRELRDLGFGVGMSVANPMEVAAGPLSPPDAFHRLIDPVLAAQPYTDLLFHLNVQSYLSYGGEGIAVLEATLGLLAPDRWPGTRVVVVLRNAEAASPDQWAGVHRAALAAGVPTYRTFDEAGVALAAGQRFDRCRGATGD